MSGGSDQVSGEFLKQVRQCFSAVFSLCLWCNTELQGKAENGGRGGGEENVVVSLSQGKARD